MLKSPKVTFNWMFIVFLQFYLVKRCTPTKCGRLVLDGLLAPREIEVLNRLAIEGTQALGGGAGGASILELSSSTVSSGEKFQR